MIRSAGLRVSSVVARRRIRRANAVEIRGKRVDVYYYPGTAGRSAPAGKVVFAPGDGGWRGLAVTMVEALPQP